MRIGESEGVIDREKAQGTNESEKEEEKEMKKRKEERKGEFQYLPFGAGGENGTEKQLLKNTRVLFLRSLRDNCRPAPGRSPDL